MKRVDSKYRKLVLVCQNLREGGANCCMKRGAGDLYPALKAAVKEATVDVRVSKTSCMGVCATGSTVVIMPDNIWLGEVSVDDIPEILAMLSVE
jgi:sirohydrochlorin cobaltochelatase